jgi:transposase
MTATNGAFTQWLSQAQIAEDRLTTEQRGLLQCAFAFRQRCGDDYYSSRLLSHFLLHCGSGLKVAQIARLVGISRPTASHQQGVSSKEAVQAAHHRMAGRPHGKLLPRYAGPIAEFILTHTDATRYDILDFIERTWSVRVSTVALHHFCKKFGLDRATRAEATARAEGPTVRPEDRNDTRAETTAPLPSADRTLAEPRRLEIVPPSQPVPLPPPPFSRRGRNTRGRSC